MCTLHCVIISEASSSKYLHYVCHDECDFTFYFVFFSFFSFFFIFNTVDFNFSIMDKFELSNLIPYHVFCSGGIVDIQERGLRESDWDDPIDSREEGTQKYATSSAAATARIAAIRALSATATATSTSTSTSTSASPSSSKDPINRKGAGGGVTTASSLLAKAASDFGSKSGTTKSNNSNTKNKVVEVPPVNASLEAKKIDDELRKMILNAPRRITKIESSIAKHELEIKKIDDEMLTV